MGESVSAFQVLLTALTAATYTTAHPLEHRHHDMMRPYVVLPRRLPRGVADGHGADARIPGRPPNP